MSLHLLRNAQVYAPESLGRQDVLVTHGKIAAIEPKIDWSSNVPVQEYDCNGAILCPGFVDSLTHITGGGGEGGFATRTPEMQLKDAVEGGVTTVTGALGTDATCRTHQELIAKVKALKEEGLSAYFYTGNYHFPVKTVTGDIQQDIMLLEECIGVGEIAIADHRGSQIGWRELAKVGSDARVAGMCSGKSGIVMVHVGSAARQIDDLFDVAQHSDLPLSQFYPTHMNRNPELFKAGLKFMAAGGTIDLTASTTPEIIASGEVSCAAALAQAIDAGADTSRITFSTDGHASLPVFNEQGELASLKVGSMRSLLEALQACVLKADLPLDIALTTVTTNPARVLGLKTKGKLCAGNDADLLLLSPDNLELQSVMAHGQWFMQNGTRVRQGHFE